MRASAANKAIFPTRGEHEAAVRLFSIPTRRYIALLALGALTVTGCSRSERATSAHATGRGALHPWTHPGELRVAMSGDVNTLNPILATQAFEAEVSSLIMDPLVATKADGTNVGILAATVPTLENGGIAKNGLTITYHLRHGVKWQDGVPFSSHDVAFSWRAVMNPNTAVATRHGYDVIAAIDTPDLATVVIHLKRPFAPFVQTFFADSDTPYDILPEHILGKYHDLNNVPFNSLPIGTGPYRLVKWARGDRFELAANDDYFLGRPKIPKITIHIVPDENTIVTQMQSHEIDWFIQATPRVYRQVKAIEGLDVRLVPFNGYDAIQFNTQAPPFDDARVRRAIGFAIDKPALVRDVTYNVETPATEDLPSFLWASDPHAGRSTRDLPAAEALLDSAGWHPGPGGIRVRNGKRLALQLAFRTDSLTDRNRGVVIASMLKDAGVDVELKGYTTALLYAASAEGGIMATGHYQAALTTWYAGADPDDSSQILCDQFPPAGLNWSRYCNHAVDEAEASALAHYDRPTRARAYAKVQQALATDAPSVYLWWPRTIEPVNSDLKNFAPGVIEDWNAYAWTY
jgi:peptide/nickel transport system substrate-binding protein